MADEKAYPTVTNSVEDEGQGINFMDILYLCLSKWYWIVISIIVCLTIGALYIKVTPPTYTRSASVLIKENGQKRSAGTINLSDLADFGLSSNIYNEILTFKSPSVMSGVVKMLGLDVDCYADGFFYDKLLYGKTLPYRVSFVDLNEVTLSGTLTMNGNGSYQFQIETFGGEKCEDIVKGNLADTVALPVGRMVVTPNEMYIPNKEKEFAKELKVVKYSDQIAIDKNLARLGAELANKQADVINIDYVDVSKERATDIINAIIQVYNNLWLNEKNMIMVSTSEFINNRLAIIEKELGSVDDSIFSYKSSNLIPDIEQAAGFYFAKSNETTDKLMDLNNRKSMAEFVRQQLGGSLDKSQLLPANAVIENSALEKMISEYNTTLMQRNTLAANSNEQNPYFLEINQRLADMRKNIAESLDNYIFSIAGEIKNLEHKEAVSNSQLAASPTQAKYILSVERQQKVKEALYLYLLQKREENEISQTFASYNTRIINYATGSNIPVAPAKNKILLIAFAIGLIIPIGVIYLVVTLDTKVRGSKDIEKLSTPYVGEIPYAGKEKKQHFTTLRHIAKKIKELKSGKPIPEVNTYEVVVKDGKRDYINEAFRVVRTNLEFMLNNDNEQVIMLTSFNSGSGKTFICMNIAVSYAIKGKKVAVIDLDLRKASLSTFVNSPKEGVANYLNNDINDFHSIMQKGTVHKLMDVIPVGSLPPNPSELLYSKRLEEMIDALRQEYDYIFIDCPPVDMLADASIVNKWVDRTLFIIRAGLLERDMLPKVDLMYKDKKCKNLAVLLNGTERAGGRYGYGKYGYYSKYGYGYGYYGGGTYASNSN